MYLLKMGTSFLVIDSVQFFSAKANRQFDTIFGFGLKDGHGDVDKELALTLFPNIVFLFQEIP